MLRWLYIQLIWLHPAPFRWRFGDDMLDDFDRAPNRAKPRYFADAAVSLARQWILRPEYHHPEGTVAADTALRAAGIPVFYSMETYKPRPAALLQGGLLAVLSILTAVLLIDKAGGVARPFFIGVHTSRPSLLHVDRSSVEGTDLSTAVKQGPNPFDAWLKLAQPYFASLPVLRVLDTDRDLTLSPQEIAAAPSALLRLDTNHAGKLTAFECGLHFDPAVVPQARQAQLRQLFMASHPVLAVLDADHDGEISAREIENAAASLKTLDRNHDGYLSADELIPFEMAFRAHLW